MTIEGLCRGRLPFLGCFLHTLEGLAGLLRTGNVVRNGHGRCDRSRRHRQPHSRGTAQDSHEALDAAASLADCCGKLADACRKRTDTLGQLAEDQHHRTDCGSNGGEADDLHPLRFVQIHEAVQQIVRAFDEALDRGIEIIAQLLPEEDRLVLEVGELAFRCGVALVGLGGQGGVLRPCAVCGCLRPAEQIGGIGGTQQRIAQAYLLDADLVQHGDGTFARVVHLGETYDKCLKRSSGVTVKQCLELCAGHAADSTEVLQCLTARRRGNLHLDERLGKG